MIKLKAQPKPIQDNDKYPGVPGSQTKSNSVHGVSSLEFVN